MKNLIKKFGGYSVKNRKYFLFVFFILAFILRILYLPKGALSFAYDQARDAFVVQELLSGDLKVLGPPVSGVPGLFHGVLYYYVIAPIYFISHGNPIAIACFTSFISSLGVFVVYYFAYLLSKKHTAGLVSSMLFAFSFEASQYANLLTNASLAVWFTPLIYIGLYLWIKKKNKWSPIVTGLFFGLSVQSEIALFYHLGPIVLWLWVSKEKINKKEIYTFVLSFLASISTFLISEIKFGFTGLNGLLYLFSSQDAIVKSKTLSDFLITAIDHSGKVFANNIFPSNLVFGGLLGLLIVYYSVKERKIWGKLLTTYIFAYLIALPFGGWNMKHILVGVSPAISVLVGVFIYKNFSKMKFLMTCLLLIILVSNITTILTENKNGQTLFPLQKMTLSDQINVMDYTYQEAEGEPFSISTLTSPLFVNTLWSYIYNYYGKSKYGYLPYWIGKDQVGQLGNNLKKASGEVKKHFFIIEPTYGIPERWVGYAYGEQNSMSTLAKEQKFGLLVVQERMINN